jgi:hypothetical protein
MPAHRGEGMTGSPYRLPRTGKPNTEDAQQPTTRVTQDGKQHNQFRPSCPEQHAPNGAAVKASGRYAVGLHPSLDPDAYFDAPSQDQETRKPTQNNIRVGS